MKKLVSHALATATAVGLVFTPIAAQAGTRAGDNASFYAPSAMVGASAVTAVDGEEAAATGQRYWLFALLGFAAIIGGLVAAGGGNASNGAN